MFLTKKNSYILLGFFFIYALSFAQRGLVSGVIEDESGPLPGVVIVIKGTANGTETDFDGMYSIQCQVGDVLLVSFVGMTTREVVVKREMFSTLFTTSIAHEEPVLKIINKAYSEALKTIGDSLAFIPEISESRLVYNKKGNYFNYTQIKQIKEKDGKLKITYFSPETLYEIKYSNNLAFQYTAKNSLAKLQESFAQGKPSNGVNQWFDPETNTIFSFGPAINSLTFDGSNYRYDTNGRLVNGISEKQLLPYDNSLFKPSLILSNDLNLKISNQIHYLNVAMNRKTQKDIFSIEKRKRTQFDFNYSFKKTISAFFKTISEVNNQPNTNGFYSNLILSSYVTPISFQNNQAYIFNNETQRSFSPSQFNNPNWLLALNQNRTKASTNSIGFKTNIKLGKKLWLNSIASYTKKKNTIAFGLPKNTVGFENGYKSKKDFFEKTLFSYLDLKYEVDIRNFSFIEMKSSLKFSHHDLKYNFLEEEGFQNIALINPVNKVENTHQLQDNTLRFSNEIKFNFETNFDTKLTVKNSSIQSKLQGEELFLPSIEASIDVREMMGYIDWLQTFSIAIGFAKEASKMPLYYSNLSHNSLVISPEESKSFLTNNDLFNSKHLDLEMARTFDIETNIGLFYNTLRIGVNYYTSETDNAIFPIAENDIFNLQNVANIKNQGIEASLEVNIGRNRNKFYYTPTFIFSKNKSTVLHLSDYRNSIPIAGFNSLSKNLIVGEQTGTIVGSAFLRNSNGFKIIDADGYPIVDTQSKIIGNTTPDFNLSMNNRINIGKFKVNFLLDYQHGGDVWNGTKNVLNYTGRSQESANLRGTTNFIFAGVNQSGTTNITPVDFANPNQDISQNRWVRYGFNGVDEAAIVDGTYLNLKSLSVSYNFSDSKHNFFKLLDVSLYGYNLFTYTKSSGITPYSSLFDHATAKGLDYFNTPLRKEIGLKINIKI